MFAILDAHGAALHALLLRLTLRPDVADDLLQELFVKLATSPQLHVADNPLAYVKRAAINLALDWRRARNRRPERTDVTCDAPVSEEPSPLDALADAEQVDRALDASASLSELARQAFVMRYVQQESFEAVAVALGKTPHQARGLCHAAVRELREQLNAAETEVRRG